MTLFKIKAVKKGRPHKIALSFDFMDTFSHSEIEEQHLLCELYLHEFSCPMDIRYNITPLVWDIQIRDFTSFVNNHVTWGNAFQTVRKNEVNASLMNKVVLTNRSHVDVEICLVSNKSRHKQTQ